MEGKGSHNQKSRATHRPAQECRGLAIGDRMPRGHEWD